MKAILIDSRARKVTAIEYNGSLEQTYSLIDCDCITAIRSATAAGDDLLIDDEGLINGTDSYFWIQGHPQLYAGNGLLVGPPDRNGDSTDVQSTADELRARLHFYAREEVPPDYLDDLVEVRFVPIEDVFKAKDVSV